METKKYAQQIVDELLYLPKEKIIEVADFVHFLREKMQHRKTTLHEAGLTRAEALDLKRRLSTFESDWNIPGMDAYDDL
jgi:antirestriction protein ArdC